MVESGRRCQRWCSEPLSSSVLHQRRLSRHHKVWDLEDIEHLRTWPALCRSAPVPTGFAATPSAPRAVLRAQGAHTSLLHTTGSSLHISIDCGSVGAGGRRKLQHGGGLCGSGAASASGAGLRQLGAGPIGCYASHCPCDFETPPWVFRYPETAPAMRPRDGDRPGGASLCLLVVSSASPSSLGLLILLLSWQNSVCPSAELSAEFSAPTSLAEHRRSPHSLRQAGSDTLVGDVAKRPPPSPTRGAPAKQMAKKKPHVSAALLSSDDSSSGSDDDAAAAAA
eukprot:COSAG06_NODE_6799_length_2776_cov_2.916698_1_plen_280_part_10